MICGRCNNDMTPVSLGGNNYCSSCGSIISSTNTNDTVHVLPFDPTKVDQAYTANKSEPTISSLRFGNEKSITEDKLQDQPKESIMSSSLSPELEKSTITEIQENRIQKHTFNEPVDNKVEFPIKNEIISSLPGGIQLPSANDSKTTETIVETRPTSISNEEASELPQNASSFEVQATTLNANIESLETNKNIEPIASLTETTMENEDQKILKDFIENEPVPQVKNTEESAQTQAVESNKTAESQNITDKEIDQINTSQTKELHEPEVNTEINEHYAAEEEPDEFKTLLANLTAEITKANNVEPMPAEIPLESPGVTASQEIGENNIETNSQITSEKNETAESLNDSTGNFQKTENNPAFSGYKLNEPQKVVGELQDLESENVLKIPQPEGILLDILSSQNAKPTEEVTKTVDKVLDGIKFNEEKEDKLIIPTAEPPAKKEMPKKFVSINDIINPITHPELNPGIMEVNKTATVVEDQSLKKTNNSEELVINPPKTNAESGSPKELLESIHQQSHEAQAAVLQTNTENNPPQEEVLIQRTEAEKIVDLDTKEMKKSEAINDQQKSGALKDYFSSIINDRPLSEPPKFNSSEDNETKSLKKLRIVSAILFGTSIIAITISLIIIGIEKNKIQLKNKEIEARINITSNTNSDPILLTEPGDWGNDE